jgi:hypothetical protein
MVYCTSLQLELEFQRNHGNDEQRNKECVFLLPGDGYNDDHHFLC